MYLEELEVEVLWAYYQRGYHCLVRSGKYFRQVLRPAMSHIYFHRAVPLLQEYSRANHTDTELPPGFSEQMEACPLTARDLLHLDYAISLGYAEVLGHNPRVLVGQKVMNWPGPGSYSGVFIAADALAVAGEDEDAFLDDDMEGGNGNDGPPPFDL